MPPSSSASASPACSFSATAGASCPASGGLFARSEIHHGPHGAAPRWLLSRSVEHRAPFQHSGHCWRTCMVAPTMSRPEQRGMRQPFVTTGGGALPFPLPMPAQPATLTATRVATKAMSTFFIGVPLFSRHAMHTSCLAALLVARCRQCVHCLRRQRALQTGLCPRGHSLAPVSSKLA